MKDNDLISRAAAIAEIEDYIEEYSELEPDTGYHNLKWCAMEEAKDVLTMLPTVDAVSVVHCRNCKYGKLCFDADGHRLIQCTNPYYPASFVETWPFDLDWYCAGGKWRDNDG